jgi:hypothetical protein
LLDSLSEQPARMLVPSVIVDLAAFLTSSYGLSTHC